MYVSIPEEELEALLPSLSSAVKRIDARLESALGAVDYEAPAALTEGDVQPEAFGYQGPAILVRSEVLDVDEITERLSNEEEWLLRHAESKTSATALRFYPAEENSVGIVAFVSE